ncbi:hypothetical protein [Phenylobacterium sp.]|uniref:hypothetical protein n=1 Tax=Phenylobacterium sp. TaxID=1871053 RepID=UPI00286A30EF|nr:hypothetical protein [Phenylobacterium sp.]
MSAGVRDYMGKPAIGFEISPTNSPVLRALWNSATVAGIEFARVRSPFPALIDQAPPD